MVISGGCHEESSGKTMKRKWKEIASVASTSAPPTGLVRHPLSFEDEDLLNGKPNKHIPLPVSVVMVNKELRRILVDQGSSANILFPNCCERLGLSRDNLFPYIGIDLSSFNGSRTMPLGYFETMVPFGEEPTIRSVKAKFLVLSCPSIYNAIIGRPTLRRLGAVTSTVHLKMKFHSLCNKVITVHADIEASERYYHMYIRADKKARE